MEHQDTHPLLIRQGIYEFPYQFPGFFPCIRKLRLTGTITIFYPIHKIFNLCLCSNIRKQKRIILGQSILGRICHNLPKPCRKMFRLF